MAGPSGNALASPSALLSSSTTVPSSSLIAAETKDSVASEGGRGVKRKFELDDGTVSRLADEQERKALDLIEREQAEKRKAKLPNFWLVRESPTLISRKWCQRSLMPMRCPLSSPLSRRKRRRPNCQTSSFRLCVMPAHRSIPLGTPVLLQSRTFGLTGLTFCCSIRSKPQELDHCQFSPSRRQQ